MKHKSTKKIESSRMEALQKTGTQEKHDDLTALGTYPINPKKAKAASPSDPRDGF